MASISKPQVVTFSGGEVDRNTLARIDLDIHPSTAERMENIFLTSQGAMELPPGTRFIGETPNSAFSVLRDWNFSVDLSYALELSSGLIRFIYDGAYEAVIGAPASIGDFTDDSGVPTGGGDPPPGGGGVLAVVATLSAGWEPKKDGYDAFASYEVTGGNGDYVSPAVVNIVSGTTPDSSYASGGFVSFGHSSPATFSFSITVQDSAGNIGTSNTVAVS